MTRNAESQQAIDKLKAKLWQPPPGVEIAANDKRNPWSAENEMAALSALKVSLGSTGKAAAPR